MNNHVTSIFNNALSLLFIPRINSADQWLYPIAIRSNQEVFPYLFKTINTPSVCKLSMQNPQSISEYILRLKPMKEIDLSQINGFGNIIFQLKHKGRDI